MKTGCDLKTCLMCRLCVKDWIPAIDAHRKNYQFSKGELLFSEGEAMNGIYFIYKGTVKVHKRWGEDKQLILRFAKDGEIVGHRGLGKDNYFPVSATSIETTTVCFINNDFFTSSLHINHDFLYQLMLFYASELKDSENNMRNLAHMQVKTRIAQALLTLNEKFGASADGDIDIMLSRQDLSSFVGTTYETLFRMLNEMTTENLIVQLDKKIRIINFDKLQSMINLSL